MTQPQDPAQIDPAEIDVSDETSVETWAQKLDASPQQIRDAVGRVGPRADEVELDLKGTRSSTNSERTAANTERPR